ncbi:MULTISPECIES: polysaccharide biosynthesis tyrosine autokinase [Mycobacteriaceae]|uniref:non-specific protein-tyrosine kinase n=1 Tax=Mycolicibacterium neoaurum VKM Ac-1815D TaxID=700508 RepID=V5X881_MYCNE|nr:MULTISPECIES: polysaccharide biosynthesis tyrosine autokinase [Mycobacteriaceae]AHC24222.1 protein tyrosine kinase [Mycolicibacterium neoaurum VKM Ac-1815D]AMO04843.1 protein tyrosine kinase [Mycolicibacterium neoaurum]AXK76850.1 protein tyrosine kinase [Mycolicibacterium neoaurum]KJQ51948.1 protein tyrosine kinase [Mycolicibacterium neoaurum]
MNLQDVIKLLRTRWLTVCVATGIGLMGAVVYTLLTTPLYQASTRLFVSTTGGETLAESYQGNRVSQDRVASYAELLMGRSLAQRTIDKLGLPMSAEELQAHVKATAKLNTVLINVDVLDESPVEARDIANALSDEFVNLVRELETPEDGTSPSSRVVVEQRASIPDDPVVPKTSRNILLGLLAGLAAGIGLAILRDVLDNTVKDRQALDAVTGTGLVGSIPMDKERKDKPAIAFDTDNSLIAEAFRKIRTNLHFLAVDNPPRVILITSSVPSEGKSTTAINIALALAEADHNVVLVDGDMRRPTLHKYLNLIGQVGFSTILSGRATLSESLQKSQFPGLTVLTSGEIPPNPSELLGSQAAKSLLSELRSQFDYVIVDTTPLLAVTDAAILAAEADGVLVIARYGRTKRDQLAHAVESLRDVGATVLGAVFTLTPSRGGSYYHYDYKEGSSPRGFKGRRRATKKSTPSAPPAGTKRSTQSMVAPSTSSSDLLRSDRTGNPD